MKKKYWLMKSEPNVFSIDQLKKSPKQINCWDGVRNFQARNFMRDDMKKGDDILFYHSNCNPPGISGRATIVKEGYPDYTSWDENSKYYDKRSSEKNPIWYMVDIKFCEKFSNFIPLEILRKHQVLKNMIILKKGNRLSITPVTKKEFDFIIKLGNK